MNLSMPIRLFCSRLRNIRGLAANIIDKPVIVLCYHRVTAMPTDINSIAVSPDNFRAQIRYLKDHFPIVRFDENLDKIKKPAIAVTFDDGYADNLTEALPILNEAGVPATFFISTQFLDGGGEFWWDSLARIVTSGSGYPAHFTLQDPGFGKTWATATVAERLILFRDLHRLCMVSATELRGEWLRQVADWAGGSCQDAVLNRLLSIEELRELANHAGVTIGAHTITHPRLSTLSDDEQHHEIVESGRRLAHILGREITSFAYPFGTRTDFNEASGRICRKAGYLKAAAAFPGEVHSWTNPYLIPRHFVYNWDLEKFVYNLKRLWI